MRPSLTSKARSPGASMAIERPSPLPIAHAIESGCGARTRRISVCCILRSAMAGERSMSDVLRNLLHYGDLSFHDFVEIALYHPQFGYYATAAARVGKEEDYVTSSTLSPVFAYAIGRLLEEFLTRAGAGSSSIVDIGSRDGTFIGDLAAQLPAEGARFYGVDRSLEAVQPRER